MTFLSNYRRRSPLRQAAKAIEEAETRNATRSRKRKRRLPSGPVLPWQTSQSFLRKKAAPLHGEDQPEMLRRKSVSPSGLEPLTFGFGGRKKCVVTIDTYSTYEKPRPQGAENGTVESSSICNVKTVLASGAFARSGHKRPTLASVATGWR